MRVLPGKGVTGTALVNGKLDLRVEGRSAKIRCNQIGAAMWAALRHNDGFVDLAVESLAREWETDPRKVRVAVDAWSQKMIDDGWLRLDR